MIRHKSQLIKQKNPTNRTVFLRGARMVTRKRALGEKGPAEKGFWMEKARVSVNRQGLNQS